MIMLKKDTTFLTNANYISPKTILTLFYFEPKAFYRRASKIEYKSIEGKEVYILDGLFQKEESLELRQAISHVDFGVKVFSSVESLKKKEKPCFSMNSKDRWRFFSHPPKAIRVLFNLFGMFADKLDIEVTTHPWYLSGETCSAPAFIANLLEEVSAEHARLGLHEDFNTETGVSFGIPNLYDGGFHDLHFINGDEGKPWLITFMLYSTSEDYRPEYGMGTGFYQKDGKRALLADCIDMRLVFFEGEIIHTAERSEFPPKKSPWRISYVFKLTLNPTKKNQNIKKAFSELML